jgi:hypothetical protein
MNGERHQDDGTCGSPVFEPAQSSECGVETWLAYDAAVRLGSDDVSWGTWLVRWVAPCPQRSPGRAVTRLMDWDVCVVAVPVPCRWA